MPINSFLRGWQLFIILIITFNILNLEIYAISNGQRSHEYLDSNDNFAAVTSIGCSDSLVLCGIHLKGIFKSTDFGLTWISLFNLNKKMFYKNDELENDEVFDIQIQNSKCLVRTLFSKIYYSGDNGNNWIRVNTPVDSLETDITAMLLLDSNIIIAIGNKIYKSNNIGFEWKLIEKIDSECGIYSIKFNLGTLYSKCGNLFYKSLHDDKFNVFKNIPYKKIMYGNIGFIGSDIYLATDLGIYFTSNMGNTWDDITFDVKISESYYTGGANIYCFDNSVYLINRYSLYILDDKRKMWIKCNIHSESIGNESVSVFTLNKNDRYFLLGSTRYGIFLSEDGFNFYPIDNNLFKTIKD